MLTYVAAALVTVGLALAIVFVRQPLRALLGAKQADALQRWRAAPLETRAAIRRAWQSGAVVEDPADAVLAVDMARHNDAVVAATNRVTASTCLPLLPGIVLLVASTNMPRVIWVVILAPMALVIATYPLAVRSRRRRNRSVELTKRQHSLA